MPEFPVVLDDADGSIVVKLNKAPKKSSWFRLSDGTPAQAKDIRMIGGEKVIFARRGTEADQRRLESRSIPT